MGSREKSFQAEESMWLEAGPREDKHASRTLGFSVGPSHCLLLAPVVPLSSEQPPWVQTVSPHPCCQRPTATNMLCHMTPSTAPKPLRQPDSLTEQPKSLAGHIGDSVLSSLCHNFPTPSPHRLPLFPPPLSHLGLLAIPQTDWVCSCLRALARAVPLPGTAFSDT